MALEKPIDWELVDKLLMAGCSGTEIAPHFNIHEDTLYNRTSERYGMHYSAYSAKMYEKGNSCLRNVQYDKALAGDNTMMVWLGKNRLKQRDTPIDVTVTQMQIETSKAIMDQLTKAQNDRSTQSD